MPLHSTPPSRSQSEFIDLSLPRICSPVSRLSLGSIPSQSPPATLQNSTSRPAKTNRNDSFAAKIKPIEDSTKLDSSNFTDGFVNVVKTDVRNSLRWQQLLGEDDSVRIEDDHGDENPSPLLDIILKHERFIGATPFLAVHLSKILDERQKSPSDRPDLLISLSLTGRKRPMDSQLPFGPNPPSPDLSFVKRSNAIPRARASRQQAYHLKTNFLTMSGSDMSD